jgi:hypothetical protein
MCCSSHLPVCHAAAADLSLTQQHQQERRKAAASWCGSCCSKDKLWQEPPGNAIGTGAMPARCIGGGKALVLRLATVSAVAPLFALQ